MDKSVSKGIFEEWHTMVGGQSAFGIQEAKDAFRKLVDHESNLTLLTETECCSCDYGSKRSNECSIAKRWE